MQVNKKGGNVFLFKNCPVVAAILLVGIASFGFFIRGSFALSLLLLLLCGCCEIFFLIFLRRKKTRRKIIFLFSLLVLLFGVAPIIDVLFGTGVTAMWYFEGKDFIIPHYHFLVISGAIATVCFSICLYINHQKLKNLLKKDLKKYYLYGWLVCGGVFVLAYGATMVFIKAPSDIWRAKFLFLSHAGLIGGLFGLVYYCFLMILTKKQKIHFLIPKQHYQL